MKRIIIDIDHVKKIDEAIKNVEGKATARTISHFAVLNAKQTIENHMAIPKRALNGCNLLLIFTHKSFQMLIDMCR